MATRTRSMRIDLSLPKRTVEAVDRFWPRQKFDSRSAFFDEAARWYMKAIGQRKFRDELREELKRGYHAMAEENLALVNEWEVASTELVEPHAHKAGPRP